MFNFTGSIENRPSFKVAVRVPLPNLSLPDNTLSTLTFISTSNLPSTAGLKSSLIYTSGEDFFFESTASLFFLSSLGADFSEPFFSGDQFPKSKSLS